MVQYFFELLAGVEQPAGYRPPIAEEQLRHLVVGHVPEMPQHDHLPVLVVEPADRPPDAILGLVPLGDHLRVEAVARPAGSGHADLRVVQRTGPADPPLPQMAEAQIPQDLVEPREELALGVELVIVLVGPKKCLLRQLQGVFAVADQTQSGQVGIFHVLLDDQLKRLSRPQFRAGIPYAGRRVERPVPQSHRIIPAHAAHFYSP